MAKHLVALAVACLAGVDLSAVDCSVKFSFRSVTANHGLCVVNISYPYPAAIPIAADRWNDTCDGGYATPQLNYGGGCSSTDVPIRVVYEKKVSDNGKGTCGSYVQFTTGANTGGTVIMYESGRNMETQEIYPCSSANITDTLTHELGHALGLNDVSDLSCYGHIMGKQINFTTRSIRADDCSAVDQLWTSTQEQNDLCSGRCWTTCEDSVCPPEPTSTVPTPCQTSPVLIDLDNNGFHLAGLTDAVTFDIDGDGVPNRISWTARGTDDAFLVYDRNGNGRIDSGRELFGDSALMRSGETASNGYEPLAEFDEPAAGGDGDTVLTSADAVWDLLQVWTDTNHNGTSEPDELRTLVAADIVAIETTYQRSNRRDAHGNMYRFRSTAVVERHNHVHPAPTYDVFFTEER
jgi:hypothetical protein